MDSVSDNPFRAIGLKIASVFLFVVMAALIKAASSEVPPGEAVFFRSLCALPVIFVWLVARGELSTGLKANQPMSHMIRGVMGSSAMGLSFAGLAMLPLSEVKSIQYATPLFVVVLAVIFLGERVRMVRLTAVGLGLVGVMIILWPRLSTFSGGNMGDREALGAMLVLAGSLCAAFTQVFVRKMVKSENTAAIVFWFSLTASGLSLLSLPWGWAVPSAKVLVFLIGAGLVGGTGQILVTSAYRFGDAGLIAPFEYVSMLIAVAIGYGVFGEVPTTQMLLGALLVIAAGVLIILRERQLKLQRGEARKVVTKYG